MRTAGSRARFIGPAFTLVELVVVLTIVALIVGLAFPSLSLLNEVEPVREPIEELAGLARELRSRAILEERPFQMIFDQGIVYAMPFYHSYDEGTTMADHIARLEEERLKQRQEIERAEIARVEAARTVPEGNGPPDSAPPPAVAPPHEDYADQMKLPEGMRCELLPWGAMEWLPLDGRRYHRWVFQPSGLCDPLQLRLSQDEEWVELSFDVLTAEISRERHYAQR